MPAKDVVKVDAIIAAIKEADTPEQLVDIEAKISAAEGYMRKSGLYPKEIKQLNEARMRARWKLGHLLIRLERAKAPGKGKMNETGFLSFLQKVGLKSSTATEAQRIAALPEKELESILAKSREENNLNTFDELLRIAKPYWTKIARKTKHQKIAKAAEGKKNVAIVTGQDGVSHFADDIGPFPLIYADPPWKFETWSENGLERTPDKHYPTLTDEEIIGYLINGKTIQEIANDKAALFLWCTSSNIPRALRVLDCWGFQFNTTAVWLKDKMGLGYVFRNQHELLLYGTRGGMPAPQYQPASVFAAPRLEHSAKPEIVRTAIEKMYPDFDESARLELFARGGHSGWTCWGLEAGQIIDRQSTGDSPQQQQEFGAA